jgi:hypothetical protein
MLQVTTQHDRNDTHTGNPEYIAGHTLWRTYFPGVFSGLFSVVFGKDSRIADSVKANVLLVALQMVRCVCSDKVHAILVTIPEHENHVAKFLEVLGGSSKRASSDPAPSVSSIGAGLPFVEGTIVNAPQMTFQ